MICGRCGKDYSSMLVDLSQAGKYFCEKCIEELTVPKVHDKSLAEVNTDAGTRSDTHKRIPS